MAPKVDVLQAFIKTAAISGIGLFWVNFTLKAFKMAWHIMFTSREEKDSGTPAPSHTHLPPKKSTLLEEEESWEVIISQSFFNKRPFKSVKCFFKIDE